MGIVNFGFYGGANSVHWLFGFKYWVISKEMPKVVEGNQKNYKKNEKCYKIINIIGLIVNLTMSAW